MVLGRIYTIGIGMWKNEIKMNKFNSFIVKMNSYTIFSCFFICLYDLLYTFVENRCYKIKPSFLQIAILQILSLSSRKF